MVAMVDLDVYLYALADKEEVEKSKIYLKNTILIYSMGGEVVLPLSQEIH